jgi:hypothetical protein
MIVVRFIEASLNQEKGIAVHGLVIVPQDLKGIAQTAHGGKDIYAQGFGSGPGLFGQFAGFAPNGAFGTKIAAVEEEEESLLVAGEKDLAFNPEKLPVDGSRPGVPILGLGHAFLEMEDGPGFVLLEEKAAIVDRGDLGRAGCGPAVFGASELAFHPDPSGDDDFSRVELFEVLKSVSMKNVFERFPVDH